MHTLSRTSSPIISLAVAAVLLLSGGAAVALPPLPTYTCLKAHTRPVIDGRLEEAIWAFTPEMRLVDCTTGAAPRQTTKIKLLWDNNYLYVGGLVYEVDIQDPNRKHGDIVFEEACFEVYLAHPMGLPTDDSQPWRYLEVDVSPKGYIFSNRVTNHVSRFSPSSVSRKWEGEDYYPPDLRAATRIIGTVNDSSDTDCGWWFEMQIPLTGPPRGWPPCVREGCLQEIWRFNLYRIRAQGDPEQEVQAWSPTGVEEVHVPRRFGHLRFADYPYWPWP